MDFSCYLWARRSNGNRPALNFPAYYQLQCGMLHLLIFFFFFFSPKEENFELGGCPNDFVQEPAYDESNPFHVLGLDKYFSCIKFITKDAYTLWRPKLLWSEIRALDYLIKLILGQHQLTSKIYIKRRKLSQVKSMVNFQLNCSYKWIGNNGNLDTSSKVIK